MTDSRFDDLIVLMANHDYTGALERLGDLGPSALPDVVRGRALAIEAVCKDRLTEQEGFLVSFLTQVLEQVKPGWTFKLGLAEQLLELNEEAVGETVLRGLVAQLPADAGVRARLAEAVERQDRFAEAGVLYADAIRRDSRHSDALAGSARCAQALGRVDDACEAYRKYTDVTPEDALAWISLGMLETEASRFEEAEEAFRRAEDLTPDTPLLLYHRTLSAVRQGRREAAAGYVQRLAEVAPADWRCEVAATAVAEASGESGEALPAVLRGFDLALAEPDVDLQEAGLVQVFDFLRRHEMKSKAAELEGVLHSHGILPERVLTVLRAIRGEWLDAATDYFVLVTGNAPLHAAVATGDNLQTGEESRGFFRAYRVFAATAEDAAAEALMTESRSPGRDFVVEDVEAKAEAGGQYRGVRFRSGRMFFNE